MHGTDKILAYKTYRTTFFDPEGPPFSGAPIWPNMLNMPKSDSVCMNVKMQISQ